MIKKQHEDVLQLLETQVYTDKLMFLLQWNVLLL